MISVLIVLQAERFLDKSIKFEFSNKAQNSLYKLDTMRRRDVEQKKQASEGSTHSTAETNQPPPEPKKPQYTAE